MIKVVAVVIRKSGVAREEFLQLWQVEHPAYVRRLAGLRRYVQNPAVDRYREWPYDGVAELWFDSAHAVKEAFESSDADALREHEARFIGDLKWFLADEVEVPITESDDA